MNLLEVLSKQSEKVVGNYRGIVVDNDDPDKLGRVRIRIFGVYDSVIDSALPWAEPAFRGNDFVLPDIGEFWWCFFDGGNPLSPVFFMRAHRPSETTPEMKQVLAGSVNAARNAARKTGVTKAEGGTWDEPAAAGPGSYPKNMVMVTEGGIVIEYDSTPGKERIHIYHPSGSFEEVDANGQRVRKSTADHIEVDVGSRKESVGGSYDLTVAGTVGIKANGATIDSPNIKLGAASGLKACAHVDSATEHTCCITGAKITGKVTSGSGIVQVKP